MECPKCGNEVRESEKVCPFCKKVLQLECPVCHKYNRTPICDECGHVIVQKCHKCGTLGPNTGKCKKCGFSTEKSVIMNEAETEEYACLAITFPNLDDLRPALKNKQIFNKFKKKLKEALFGYAKSQDNRMQRFDETYVIKYYKEFSFTSSVKKAVKSAIELLNKIGGISYKLKKSKKVRLHCKMTILKKTFETDNNEFNTGLNIKLIKDNTEERYTDGLQLITDQYINNVISRDYTLEMIYSSQVGDELLMFYEFPLEEHIIPIVEDEKPKEKRILKGPATLPKLKIVDENEQLDEILYGNKAINIPTEGKFLSVPAHNILNVLGDLLKTNSFITLKSTERRDLPTSYIKDFLQTRTNNVIHVVCDEESKYKPYDFFKKMIFNMLHLDPKQNNISAALKTGLSAYDKNGLLFSLLSNTPLQDIDSDGAYIEYVTLFREILLKLRNSIIFVEGIDLVDETSLKILNDYLSTLVNAEKLLISFVVTTRADYAIYKNIPKLIHSVIFKEINVTKGDYEEFLGSIDEDISDIKDSFYIKKLEERSDGSLIYFKNEIQHLRDSNILIPFDGKLIINAGKALVFPGTIQELLSQRFIGLPENEGLILAYTTILGGYTHQSIIQELDINKFEDAVSSLIAKGLLRVDYSIIQVENYRLFRHAILNALTSDVKQTLANNIISKLKYKNEIIIDILEDMERKLSNIYDNAINDLIYGDFNSYLNCAKEYFKLIDNLKIKQGEPFERKNELYSILVNHLNRYPSTKVYSISKSILANASANNDDETIVNVSNLILDSALNGEDYFLAQQCIQNILTRILNPKLLSEKQDYTPQFVLFSCIHAKIAFNLAHYNQCIVICDKILSILTDKFIDSLSSKGVHIDQFKSYIMDILVYSALSRIIVCNNSLDEFMESIRAIMGISLLSEEYLSVLNRIIHLEEFDTDIGIPSDDISLFISNIAIAFKNFDKGYNIFAQNIYNAKLSIQKEGYLLFSLLCDLLIGYAYQKINLEQPISWKKPEMIYSDVYKTAQKAGISEIMTLTNWFKASLLKDKNMPEEAYELIITVANSLKRSKSKNRVLIILTYILTLNIAANIDKLKREIPILVYRITYLAEQYGLEEYYKLIEDQRVLDPDYMSEFQDAISAEQAAIEAETKEEEISDAKETEIIQEGGVPQEGETPKGE